MFGPWTAGVRAWSAGSALSLKTRSACRTAVEDRLAALDSAPGRRRRRRQNRGFVNRPWTGLRHHHAARWSRRGCRRRHWRRRDRGRGGNRRNRCCRLCRRRCWLGNRRSRFSRRRRCRGLGSGGLHGRWLFFPRCWCRGLHNRWRNLLRGRRGLDHGCSGGRRNHHHWTRNGGAGGRLGNHRARWRAVRNGRCGRWRSNNRWGLAWLRNNPARFRADRSRCGRRLRNWRSLWRGHNRPDRLGWRRRRCRCCWRCRRLHRYTGQTRLFFLFLLLGQDSLHHIAGFGDVRQIDLGSHAGCAVARKRLPRRPCRPRPIGKMRANLVRLIAFKRAGVRLAAGNTQFRKNVENRPRLHFQLFREIVNTNLAHPPLFNSVPPDCRLVAHSYLVAPAALACVNVLLALEKGAHVMRHPL